jgi:hypothetical protein
MFVIGPVVITAIMERMRRRKGETMSGFSEILTTATVLFLLTLLPVSAILAVLLSHRMAANTLETSRPRAASGSLPQSTQPSAADEGPATKDEEQTPIAIRPWLFITGSTEGQ